MRQAKFDFTGCGDRVCVVDPGAQRRRCRTNQSLRAVDERPFQRPELLSDRRLGAEPSNAERYKEAGINLYVGLWRGPTEEQLALLQARACASSAARTLSASRTRTIRPSWPGCTATSRTTPSRSAAGKGYGPPILPEKIVEDYQRRKRGRSLAARPAEPRPGRGLGQVHRPRRAAQSSRGLPEYVKGCDIASFDIYPACHDHADVAGKLWFVADGVSRLRKWAGDGKPVWNCIECTHISNPERQGHAAAGEGRSLDVARSAARAGSSTSCTSSSPRSSKPPCSPTPKCSGRHRHQPPDPRAGARFE